MKINAHGIKTVYTYGGIGRIFIHFSNGTSEYFTASFLNEFFVMNSVVQYFVAVNESTVEVIVLN